MGIFNTAANTAAIASLVSIGVDAGEHAIKTARAAGDRSVAIKDIKDLSGDSVLNKPSAKHAKMKEAVRNLDLFTGLYKAGGSISGFFKGAGEGLKRNIPALGFSVFTLCVKNKTAKTIGLAGMGLATAWDFIKNGTNLFAKKDTIEK